MAKWLGNKSVGGKVFRALVGGLGDISHVGYYPIAFGKMGTFEEYSNVRLRRQHAVEAEQRRQQRQALKRLEERRYIELKRRGAELHFKLTQNGIEAALKQAIVEKAVQLPDGQMCYVSFDIPERSKNVRWALHTLLKRAKFKIIHQSLWATHRDVAGEFSRLMKCFQAEKYVQVLVGRTLTIPLGPRDSK